MDCNGLHECNRHLSNATCGSGARDWPNSVEDLMEASQSWQGKCSLAERNPPRSDIPALETDQGTFMARDQVDQIELT